MKKFCTAFAVAVLVFMAACSFNQQEVSPSAASKVNTSAAGSDKIQAVAGVSLVNGRVKFSDMKVFAAAMNMLAGATEEELREWEKLSGHQSLRALYESIDSNPDASASTEDLFETGALLFVPDYAFASVLNQEGVFQIGSEIHVVTQHAEYIIPDEQEAILQSKAWNSPEVKKVDIKFDFIKEGEKAQKGEQLLTEKNFIGWRERELYSDIQGNRLPATWNGRPTRMKASQWNMSYAAYASAGIRTKFQFKTQLAGWQPCDVSAISLEGSGKGWYWATGVWGETLLRTYPFTTRYNDNIIDKTMYYIVGMGVFIELDYLRSFHRIVYKGAIAEVRL